MKQGSIKMTQTEALFDCDAKSLCRLIQQTDDDAK